MMYVMTLSPHADGNDTDNVLGYYRAGAFEKVYPGRSRIYPIL